MRVVELEATHLDALARFFAELPDGDLTFIREDLSADSLRSWVSAHRPGLRWVALSLDSDVVGFVAVLPLPGWSSHVGELRLVVSPESRGQGVGRSLARSALIGAVSLGLQKVTVEVVAAQEAPIAMFNHLGFSAEALLEDQIRDRHGALQDLVLLAHRVDEGYAAMVASGVVEALG